VVRFAVGAAFGALALPAPTPAGAAVCQAGQQIGDPVMVPANGATVWTPRLKNGQLYRLRVTGYVANRDQFSRPLGIDAEYAFLLSGQEAPVDMRGALDYGLSLDGAAPSWGPYNSTHVYRTYVTGADRRVALRFLDDYYPDNSGHLEVRVFCA
jgi:hypothetical protein